MRRLLLGFMLAGICLGQSSCQSGDRSSPPVRWTAGTTPLLASDKGNAPSPAPHPGVRFHSRPKPLPRGAATHDWTSFLGPSHNGVSTETRLLKDWPDGGPPLVWELAKGTGYTSPAIHGSRLVYFYRQGQEEIVDCLHPETGQGYWTFRYPTGYIASIWNPEPSTGNGTCRGSSVCPRISSGLPRRLWWKETC
ncbi:MAG: hypothetical protein OXG96_14055 [Acidobacteria bacterium]|nr:hypothetical protein [Acidobacteriota bacterium]